MSYDGICFIIGNIRCSVILYRECWIHYRDILLGYFIYTLIIYRECCGILSFLFIELLSFIHHFLLLCIYSFFFSGYCSLSHFSLECQRDIHDKLMSYLHEAGVMADVVFYSTTIYDQTILEACSRVIQRLTPQIGVLERLLDILVAVSVC